MQADRAGRVETLEEDGKGGQNKWPELIRHVLYVISLVTEVRRRVCIMSLPLRLLWNQGRRLVILGMAVIYNLRTCF